MCGEIIETSKYDPTTLDVDEDTVQVIETIQYRRGLMLRAPKGGDRIYNPSRNYSYFTPEKPGRNRIFNTERPNRYRIRQVTTDSYQDDVKRLEDNFDKMDVDGEPRITNSSKGMDIDNDNKLVSFKKSRTNWQTPAVRNTTNPFTPFPKKLGVFERKTSPIRKMGTFTFNKSERCIREGCDNEKMKRASGFASFASHDKYVSQYCSSSCKDIDSKNKPTTSLIKDKTELFSNSSGKKRNPFMKCPTVVKPHNLGENSFEKALKEIKEARLSKKK